MAREFARKFYDSAVWRNTRKYILKRDNYRCKDCGAIACEVHHIIELNENNIRDPLITISPNNLVSLCYQCHKARHERKAEQIVKTDYFFDEDGNILPGGGNK